MNQAVAGKVALQDASTIDWPASHGRAKRYLMGQPRLSISCSIRYPRYHRATCVSFGYSGVTRTAVAWLLAMCLSSDLLTVEPWAQNKFEPLWPHGLLHMNLGRTYCRCHAGYCVMVRNTADRDRVSQASPQLVQSSVPPRCALAPSHTLSCTQCRRPARPKARCRTRKW